MRRLIVAAVALAMMTGGTALAGPGPNGNNTYGLCNAYSHGSPTGQAEKQANGAHP